MINEQKHEEMVLTISNEPKKALELLKSGEYDIGYICKGGYSYLHVAVTDEQVDIVKYLLKKGINPDIRNAQGGTVISTLIPKKNKPNTLELLKLLAAYGADLDDKTKGEIAMTKREMIRKFMGEDILNQVLACVNTKVSRGKPSDEIVKVNLLNDVMLTVKLSNNTTAKNETLENLNDYFNYLLNNQADVIGFYRNKGDLLEVSISSEDYDVCYICKNADGKYDGYNLSLTEPINIEIAKKVAELFIKSDDEDFLLEVQEKLNAQINNIVKNVYTDIK